MLLNLAGEDVEKINSRTGIYFNKTSRDNENQTKGKGKSKGDKNILAKTLIPIPETYYDAMPLETANLKVERSPTIGCFTVLNTHNKMNCADMTVDGSIICIGFKDGTIKVWVLNKDLTVEISPELLKSLEEYKDTNYTNYSKILYKKDSLDISMNKEGVDEKREGNVFDEIITQQRVFRLLGHTDAIFSVSIAQDKKFIISGSYDETIRLWSIFTKQTLVVYKAHFAPVLSVKYSPLG